MTNGRMIFGALLVAFVLVGGCKKKEDDASGAGGAGDTPANATATATTPPVATPTPVPTVTAPVSHDADAAAVRGCCAALRSTGASQKVPADKSKYDASAASCDGIASLVKTGTTARGAAFTSIRAALHGQSLPAGCN